MIAPEHRECHLNWSLLVDCVLEMSLRVNAFHNDWLSLDTASQLVESLGKIGQCRRHGSLAGYFCLCRLLFGKSVQI